MSPVARPAAKEEVGRSPLGFIRGVGGSSAHSAGMYPAAAGYSALRTVESVLSVELRVSDTLGYTS